MTNRPDLDTELADMTDRLLSGQQDTTVSPDNRTEARLVRSLHQIASRNAAPDAAFRSRLTQRIHQEWDTVHRPSTRRVGRFLPRLAALAAVVVVGIGIMLVLLSESTLVGPVQATAVGPVSWVLPVILVGAVVLVGVAVWRQRK